MLSAICFNLEQSKILLSGNGRRVKLLIQTNQISERASGDDMYSKRMTLNMKVMGQTGAGGRKTFKEKFVPPELSMISYFLTKPFVESQPDIMFSYDSDDSLSSEEEESDDEIDGVLNRPVTL